MMVRAGTERARDLSAWAAFARPGVKSALTETGFGEIAGYGFEFSLFRGDGRTFRASQVSVHWIWISFHFIIPLSEQF
jgi:hypothetical protein